jgi:hypothetical protein
LKTLANEEKKREVKMSDAADYIKTQWNNIHHSRNQDWRILQIIGAIFITLIAKTIIPPDYKIAIIVVALIVSFIGEGCIHYSS